jgi:2-polyprenyl-3-methyl-5-hydroxy-6-metoxy-1,4-benzoquinol methylase
MINELHARFHRPEEGWDPIPSAYAAGYSSGQWSSLDQRLVDELEQRVDGFAGKTILDLGGGPGQYTLAMAQRGGLVTWHDVSRTYLEMSRRKADELKLIDRITFSLGYLDEAPRLLNQRFDLVFNRICWNYGYSDKSFAAVVYAMVRPGGFAYVDTTHSGFKRDELPTLARLRTWLNDHTGIKIGHPMPPHGRLARLFLAFAVKRMTIDYRTTTNDRIFFEKAGPHK